MNQLFLILCILKYFYSAFSELCWNHEHAVSVLLRKGLELTEETVELFFLS